MKVIQLFNSKEALGELIKVSMPVKKSYDLTKFIIEVDKKLEAFDKVRNELIKKYGKEESGSFTVTDENLPKFLSELSEIGDEEIDIVIPELSIDDLEGGKIEAKTLLELSYLIK